MHRWKSAYIIVQNDTLLCNIKTNKNIFFALIIYVIYIFEGKSHGKITENPISNEMNIR